ncbi:MAG: 4'-phosphopantetheinyl transferase family protein [Bacteroidota bacterium]
MKEPTVVDRPLNDIVDPEDLSARVERLNEREVHLWVINSRDWQNRIDDPECFLSEDERNRADRFRFPRDRDLFVAGRHATRLLLAHYTDGTPETVSIEPNAFGKPLSDARLHFNISHSHDQLFLGFSDSPIGVDIEKKDPSMEVERFGELHFARAEYLRMMTNKEVERQDTFFDIWTKKESLVKGIGEGLRIPFKMFNVAVQDGCVQWDIPSGHTYGDWYVRGVDVVPGYASAYATRSASILPRHFRVNP